MICGLGHLVLVAMLLTSSAAGETVERRGGQPPVVGRILGHDEAGITVKSELGAKHFIPWDRVRAVHRDTPDPLIEGRLELATRLWRARSRLERHDAMLAERLLLELADSYEGATHETALVVVEGLLRCYLARAAHASAVIPALEVLRLRRAGVTTDAYAMLSPMLDDQMGLSPLLAPVWVDTTELVRLEHDLEHYDAQGDEVVDALAHLYRAAARHQLGLDRLEQEIPSPDHPGVELLQMIIACDSPSADTRAGTRERLIRSVREAPGWAQAWARFHVGRSLTQEQGAGRQQRGLVQLAHVPARFERELPFLAGIALDLLAQGLEACGDVAAADGLRSETARRLSDHPLFGAPTHNNRMKNRTR
jgi:hypothetical protein